MDAAEEPDHIDESPLPAAADQPAPAEQAEPRTKEVKISGALNVGKATLDGTLRFYLAQRGLETSTHKHPFRRISRIPPSGLAGP